MISKELKVFRVVECRDFRVVEERGVVKVVKVLKVLKV